MLRFAFRLLVLLALFLLLRSVLRDLFSRSSRAPAKKTAPNVPVTGELKRDPVCGTYVAAQSGITTSVGGQVYYFCSEECRKKYLVS